MSKLLGLRLQRELAFATAAMVILVSVAVIANTHGVHRLYSKLYFGSAIEVKGGKLRLPENWWIKEAGDPVTVLAAGYAPADSDGLSAILIEQSTSKEISIEPSLCEGKEGSRHLKMLSNVCIAYQERLQDGYPGLIVAVLDRGIQVKAYPVDSRKIDAFLDDLSDFLTVSGEAG